MSIYLAIGGGKLLHRAHTQRTREIRMAHGNYIKTFEGYCGLPMMVAHSPELGGDLPCIFAAMPHPNTLGQVSAHTVRLQRLLLGNFFNRMSCPTAVLVAPEEISIRPIDGFLLLTKEGNIGGQRLAMPAALRQQAQTVQRTLASDLYEGVDRMARDYMQSQLEGRNTLKFL
jgi:hypothetical protein